MTDAMYVRTKGMVYRDQLIIIIVGVCFYSGIRQDPKRYNGIYEYYYRKMSLNHDSHFNINSSPFNCVRQFAYIRN